MAVRIQLRRDTMANWALVDPILADGEIGFEKDTQKWKTGNGVDAWSVLSYSNVLTDALLSKLNGIEANATADQTGLEIKTAYEANADTNALTDVLLTKINGIESGATGDQTASEILAALLTADGSGSGLDADKVDGIEGALLEKTANKGVAGGYAELDGSGFVPASQLPPGANYPSDLDEDPSTTTGLTLGWLAGQVRSDNVITDVAAGTLTLTDNATNYVEYSGGMTVNQVGFTSGAIPIRTVVTLSGAQTSSVDERAWLAVEPSVKSGAWLAYGGTANAITLTTVNATPTTAYVDGAQYRFKATAANTLATTLSVDGLTAYPVLTITGAALPAGYIRSDAETIARWDAGLSSFIADRKPEYGSNANGEYWKYAGGRLVCNSVDVSATTDSTFGGLYRSTGTNNGLWTFPSQFLTSTGLVVAVGRSGFNSFLLPYGLTTASQAFVGISETTATTVTGRLTATGRWYLP